MGAAKIMLKDGHSLICTREHLDDLDTANQLWQSVSEKKSQGQQDNSFIQCDNGGGFDARDVIGVTILTEEWEEEE